MLIQTTRSSWLWIGCVGWRPARPLPGPLALPTSGHLSSGSPLAGLAPRPAQLLGRCQASPPLPGSPSPLISAPTLGWNPWEDLKNISTHPTPSFSGPLPFLTYFLYSTFHHLKRLKIIPKEQKPCLSSLASGSPTKALEGTILGWPESPFGLSCKMVWENPNQLFGQLDIYSLSGNLLKEGTFSLHVTMEKRPSL